uniref:ras association domain-containing protein 3 n=1 Tax=Panthera onca TaxID=9690 RepID=UPI00295526E9|nr:ras association domain-containing protein 3 [Panthera onca]
MSSGYSSLEEDSEDFFFTARTSFFRRAPQGKPRAGQQDVEKEKETHNYLSKEEIKEKVHKYNLAVTDKLKMTLVSTHGTVHVGTGRKTNECKLLGLQSMCFKISEYWLLWKMREVVLTSYTLPFRASTVWYRTLMLSGEAGRMVRGTVQYSVTCRLSPHPVYACKLSDREHPLYLRLVAGPRTDTLSFVLREHEIGEWEAFSLPELQNFLRILDKEEDEQLQSLKRRYAAYRHKLEEALSEVWKPD